MPVSVKIDTFNFQKYGMIEGEVKIISKNSIEDEKLGPVYEVYITPLFKILATIFKSKIYSLSEIFLLFLSSNFTAIIL